MELGVYIGVDLVYLWEESLGFSYIVFLDHHLKKQHIF